MTEMLATIIWGPETFGVLGAFAIPISAILGGIWYKVSKLKADNELKQSMVERGLSVEEIERVLNAGSKKD